MLHDEHRVAVGVVGNCRLRQGDQVRGVAAVDFDLGVHAGEQPPVGIGERRAHLDVAAGKVHLGVDGGNLAGKARARISIHRRRRRLSDLEMRKRLLRDIEVDQDGIERLQRHHRGAGGQVLALVNLANPQSPCEGCLDGFLID